MHVFYAEFNLVASGFTKIKAWCFPNMLKKRNTIIIQELRWIRIVTISALAWASDAKLHKGEYDAKLLRLILQKIILVCLPSRLFLSYLHHTGSFCDQKIRVFPVNTEFPTQHKHWLRFLISDITTTFASTLVNVINIYNRSSKLDMLVRTSYCEPRTLSLACSWSSCVNVYLVRIKIKSFLVCAIFFTIRKQNHPLKRNVLLPDVCQLR